jgi:RNA polymerase-binding transcription factor DksA
MNCALCDKPIPAARLLAVPTTALCVNCKGLHDEPRLTAKSPVLARSFVEHSLSDLDEMSKAGRELGGLE